MAGGRQRGGDPGGAAGARAHRASASPSCSSHAGRRRRLARVAGRPGGVEDLEASIEVAHDTGSPGLVRAALEPRQHAREPRRRLGPPSSTRVGREAAGGSASRHVRWFPAERLYELYWNGAWDNALLAAAERLAEVHVGALDAPLVRGGIRLGARQGRRRRRGRGASARARPSVGAAAALPRAPVRCPRAARRPAMKARQGARGVLELWAQTRERTLPAFWGVGPRGRAERARPRPRAGDGRGSKGGVRAGWTRPSRSQRVTTRGGR